MQRGMPAIDLNQVICFEGEYPMAVPLETTLPGQLVLVVLRAGQSLPEHRVDAPATIQVLRGEGSITVAGTAYRAAAGTLVSLSAQDMHCVTASQDLVLLVYHALRASPTVVAEEEILLFSETAPLTLDVRHLTPRDRARRIFATVDALLPGEALRMIINHDPQAVLRELAAVHRSEMVWERERDGPDEWIVLISKRTLPHRDQEGGVAEA
jgi:uncharacterized protein (DUF2249 family)/quercetin dioxygenase-like cupin family protein